MRKRIKAAKCTAWCERCAMAVERDDEARACPDLIAGSPRRPGRQRHPKANGATHCPTGLRVALPSARAQQNRCIEQPRVEELVLGSTHSSVRLTLFAVVFRRSIPHKLLRCRHLFQQDSPRRLRRWLATQVILRRTSATPCTKTSVGTSSRSTVESSGPEANQLSPPLGDPTTLAT